VLLLRAKQDLSVFSTVGSLVGHAQGSGQLLGMHTLQIPGNLGYKLVQMYNNAGQMTSHSQSKFIMFDMLAWPTELYRVSNLTYIYMYFSRSQQSNSKVQIVSLHVSLLFDLEHIMIASSSVLLLTSYSAMTMLAPNCWHLVDERQLAQSCKQRQSKSSWLMVEAIDYNLCTPTL
jgi:hypothetical protein